MIESKRIVFRLELTSPHSSGESWCRRKESDTDHREADETERMQALWCARTHSEDLQRHSQARLCRAWGAIEVRANYFRKPQIGKTPKPLRKFQLIIFKGKMIFPITIFADIHFQRLNYGLWTPFLICSSIWSLNFLNASLTSLTFLSTISINYL